MCEKLKYLFANCWSAAMRERPCVRYWQSENHVVLRHLKNTRCILDMEIISSNGR